jgi:capsule polysaccharide export protein KpsC/LpsZ
MTICEHTQINCELMPAGFKHYEKITCADCGKFLGWGKHPKTIERERENAKRIKQLQSIPLDSWEQGFLASIAKARKLSPKQQGKLDAIWEVYCA